MEIQETPNWVFNCTYLLILSPTLYHLVLVHARRDHEEWAAQVLPLCGMDPLKTLWKTMLFLAWMAFLSAALRASLAHWGWKQGAKPPEQLKDDAIRMAYINVCLAVVARVQARIGMRFCAMVALYAALFALLFEMVRHVNVHIGAELAGNPQGLWIVVVGVLVLVCVLHAHVCLAFAQESSFGKAYVGWVALTLAVHAFVHVAPFSWSPSSPKLHVHHWYWALLAAHFAIFDSALSRTSQALYLGIYIHGAACFGLEPIFEPGVPRPAQGTSCGVGACEARP